MGSRHISLACIPAAVAVALAACSSSGNTGASSPDSAATSGVTTSAAQTESATSTASAPPASKSTAAAPTTVTASPTAASTPASAGPTSAQATARPSRSQTLSLALGQTAHLTYFDVTVLRSAFGKDGVSRGWKVRVCYTSHHPGENADGTTRVSTNPWSVLVRDGEGGQDGKWMQIDEFPADKGWEPPYSPRLLRVGQCAEGWLAIRDDNPDLQYPAIRYAPADFGDQVTWRTS